LLARGVVAVLGVGISAFFLWLAVDATLANEGKRVDGDVFGNRPRVVDRVEFLRSSKVHDNAPIPKPVMDESHAELITDILEDVVQSGTGTRAAIRPSRAASSRPSASARSSVRAGS
jgi:membrane peptidoglycan carboxypeptidase